MENNKKILSDLEKDYKGLSSALRKNDIEIADTWFNRIKNDYEKYKSEMDYKDSTYKATAGALGTMFESVLPTLFVNNKRAVGEIIKLIKEDSNIKSQLQFFETMKNYDGLSDAKDYIKESIDLASRGINMSTLKESNNKLASLIIKHNIKPNDVIDEDKEAFFEAGTYLLTHRKKLNNLSQISANRNIVENYINTHKKDIEKEETNIIKQTTENFDKKLGMLTEAERSLVMDIINSKSSIAEQRQRKFFDSLKEKCISKLNKMINESSDENKDGLLAIKEEITSMQYCKETIVKDTAKLLEVGSVLSDK